MPLGRPPIFTQAIADRICELLREGKSLRSICRLEGMPHRETVLIWASDPKHPAYSSFSVQYACARDDGLDFLAEEVLAIADDGSADTVTRVTEKGNSYEATDQEHIQRSRLRFDARRWYLSKLAPKRYGERLEAQLTGAGGGPITLNIVPVASPDKKD